MSLPPPPTDAAPSAEILERARRIVGEPVVSARFRRGGFSPAQRWTLTLASGARAFAKVGPTADTARFLRDEHRMYSLVRGAFMPRLLGFDDHPDAPLLVLEDLSHAHWPPPWSADHVQRVRDALARVAATPAPAHLPSLATGFASLFALSSGGVAPSSAPRAGWGWAHIARDTAPFLALGVCTPAWLERALPTLVAAESRAELEGDALLHADVRGDNLCFDGERTLFVDWNWAARGNALLDVAFWLPSLALDGGPAPFDVLQGEGAMAGFVSGFFASQAGLPPLPAAPRVRAFQLAQLREALPWTTRALGLEPADGAARTP